MFFIFPLGHEATWVRRLPVVTFTLIGLIILVYIGGALSGRTQSSLTKSKLKTLGKALMLFPCENLSDKEWRDFAKKYPKSGDLANRLRDSIQQVAEKRQAFCAMRHGQRSEQEAHRALLEVIGYIFSHYKPTIYETLGYIPAHPHFVQSVTHMFVHVGFFHIFFNLLFLWIASYALEDVWGRVIFSFLYITGGWAAMFLHAWTTPSPSLPLVGASGAISALMGAFFLRMGKVRIKMLMAWFFFGTMGVRTFWLPARVFLGFWFGRELFSFWMMSGHGSGVAYAAHVGGFLYGLAFAGLIRFTRLEERYLAPKIEEKLVVEAADPVLVEAGLAFTRGDLLEARRLLQAYLVNHQDNVDAWLSALDIAVAIPDPKLLTLALNRVLEFAARGVDSCLDPILDRIETFRKIAAPSPSPRAIVYNARSLVKQGDALKALLLLDWIPGADKVVSPGFLLEWAKLYMQQGRFDLARDLITRTRSRWSDDPVMENAFSAFLDSIPT